MKYAAVSFCLLCKQSPDCKGAPEDSSAKQPLLLRESIRQESFQTDEALPVEIQKYVAYSPLSNNSCQILRIHECESY